MHMTTKTMINGNRVLQRRNEFVV